MLLIAVLWIVLVGFTLLTGRREPPFWWMVLAISNIIASIVLGLSTVL